MSSVPVQRPTAGAITSGAGLRSGKARVGVLLGIVPLALLSAGTDGRSSTLCWGVYPVAPAVADAGPRPNPGAGGTAATRPEVIGWELPLTLPDAAAQRENATGLQKHRKADFAAAESHFRRALHAAPTFDRTRFNLACAVARQGRAAEALDLLLILLRRDFPGYFRKATSDADLATLRDGPSRPRFDQIVGEARASWEQATRSGLPVVLYREGKIAPDRGEESGDFMAYPWPAFLRAGVYLPGEKRFVPVGPPLSKAMSALVDTTAQRVWVVYGRGFYDEMILEDVSIVAMDLLGEIRVKRTVETKGKLVTAIEAHVAPDEIRVKVLEQKGGAPRPTFPPSMPAIQGAHALRIVPEGVFYLGQGADNLVVRGDTLLDGKVPRPLSPAHRGARHRALTASPDGRYLWVTSIKSDCKAIDDVTLSQRAVLTHAIERFDRTASTRALVSVGTGAAAIRAVADDAVMVQLARIAYLLASPEQPLGQPERMPGGILVVAPPQAWQCPTR
jgi:hypothetical protein